MNGIAGIYNLDGAPVDRTILDRMTGAISHRGPDGISRSVDGCAGLAHFMLFSTPESLRERQPVVDESGTYCLTMDGRIDNRDELRADLLAAGQTLRDDTDGELVLKAYIAWSDNSPQRLLGDFAYAIRDKRNRRLFCARDPLGLRPFYYWRTPSVFLWASEAAALLAHPSVPRRCNEGMIFEYLACDIVSRDETLYAGILRLPPAHSLAVSPGGVKLRRYWDIAPARQIRYRRDEEYAEHFRQLFDRAVACRLRAHAPVAVQLSGGLDSSSIAATAAGACPAAPQRLRLLSRVYPGERFDETRYIREVARFIGLPVIEVRDAEPLSYAARSARSLDFPGTPNGATWEPLFEAARDAGCRVVLTGLGGDEYFSGQDEDCADLLVRFRFRALLRSLLEYDRGTRLSAFARYACLPLLPPRFVAGLRRALRRPGSEPVPAWIGPRMAAPHAAARLRSPSAPRLGYAARRMYSEAFDGWHAQAFESNDRLAAEFGLELRHPFHDRRVIEFAFAIPAWQRRRHGLSKFVLRQAMRGRLPDSVLQRTDKAEFSLLFVRALERLGGLEGLVNSGIARAGWVVPAELARKYAAVRAAYHAGSDCFDGHLWPLWMVRALEIWHEGALGETAGRVRETPDSAVA